MIQDDSFFRNGPENDKEFGFFGNRSLELGSLAGHDDLKNIIPQLMPEEDFFAGVNRLKISEENQLAKSDSMGVLVSLIPKKLSLRTRRQSCLPGRLSLREAMRMAGAKLKARSGGSKHVSSGAQSKGGRS